MDDEIRKRLRWVQLYEVDAVMLLLGKNTAVVADAGYHSEDNLKGLSERGVDAWIADPQMRQRDERFADQRKHKAKPDPLHNKSLIPGKPGTCFKPADFAFDEATRCCICPAGKKLYSNGSECTINGYRAMKFQGQKRIASLAGYVTHACAHRTRRSPVRCLSSSAGVQVRTGLSR